MRKPNEALAQQRKTQIVEAAISCFLKSGFHNTGMKEICAAAQMSPGALYRYFDSKDAIIAAIVAHEQQELDDALAYLSSAKNFNKALLSLVAEMIEVSCQRADNILATEIFAESTRNKDVAAILRKTESTFLAGMTSLLKSAQKEKRIQLKLTAEETARTILSLVYGASTLALLDTESATSKHTKLARNVLKQLID